MRNPETARAKKSELIELYCKGAAGMSIAALVTFKAIAADFFAFSPTPTHDIAVALTGAAVGMLLARKYHKTQPQLESCRRPVNPN